MPEPTATLTYKDAFLAKRVSVDIENRAIADVALLGTFPDEWADRLAVIRAYQITCLENASKDDDSFSVKMKQYDREWSFALVQAKRAQAAAVTDESAKPSFFSIPILRA